MKLSNCSCFDLLEKEPPKTSKVFYQPEITTPSERENGECERGLNPTKDVSEFSLDTDIASIASCNPHFFRDFCVKIFRANLGVNLLVT